MENVVRFPPRYLHPEKSHLGSEILKLALGGLARNVGELAQITGANPAIIDALLDRAVPPWRLKEEAEAKRAAIARAEAAEKRVAELEAVLKANREEWVFRRLRAKDRSPKGQDRRA